MVEEAGGTVTTMGGERYTVFERSVLASNGPLHDKVLESTGAETRQLLQGGVDLSPWFVPPGYQVKA
jgi:myo-inositol-1(or 4)-monophosphatase